MIYSRRCIMTNGTTALALYLTGCSNPNATPLHMAQEYASALNAALQNASVQLLAKQPPLSPDTIATIQKSQADLTLATNTLLATTSVATTALGAAKQLIAEAQALQPIVAPLLGPYALYLPLALGVLQTFVDSLPPPANAPLSPPAELRAAATVRLGH